ncbi:MAG: hypothetical protein J3Q66DRAFT_360625 [Benniella sp.]|nr:MAG: hypothetical protein J3Q66DRAFT_360625 [Benniella sp.]
MASSAGSLLSRPPQPSSSRAWSPMSVDRSVVADPPQPTSELGEDDDETEPEIETEECIQLLAESAELTLHEECTQYQASCIQGLAQNEVTINNIGDVLGSIGVFAPQFAGDRMKDSFGDKFLASILKDMEAQSILPVLDTNSIEDLAALAATRARIRIPGSDALHHLMGLDPDRRDMFNGL